jgi:hypothetical protein
MGEEPWDDVTSKSGDVLSGGIQTYDRKSEAMARRLAQDFKTGLLDRKKLGEQLIRESSEAIPHRKGSGRWNALDTRNSVRTSQVS